MKPATIELKTPVPISNTDRHIPAGQYPAELVGGIAFINLEGERIILRKRHFEIIEKTPAL